MVGAAKAWGSGKLLLKSYTLEKVERTYNRTWEGEAFRMTPQLTITPLKTELEQAFQDYAQWITRNIPIQEEGDMVA